MPTGADEPGSAEWWAAQTAGTNVNFTNWPQYLDVGKNAAGERIHPTLEMFTEETGIEVTYRADINDNAQFYARSGRRSRPASPPGATSS